MVKSVSRFALSPFQQACLDELLSLAARHGAAVNRNELAGQREAYVVLDCTAAIGSSVGAWIYADECMLTTDARSFYFEKPDFRSSAALRSAFVAAASDLLQGKEPQQLGSFRVNLFSGRPL